MIKLEFLVSTYFLDVSFYIQYQQELCLYNDLDTDNMIIQVFSPTFKLPSTMVVETLYEVLQHIKTEKIIPEPVQSSFSIT